MTNSARTRSKWSFFINLTCWNEYCDISLICFLSESGESLWDILLDEEVLSIEFCSAFKVWWGRRVDSIPCELLITVIFSICPYFCSGLWISTNGASKIGLIGDFVGFCDISKNELND